MAGKGKRKAGGSGSTSRKKRSTKGAAQDQIEAKKLKLELLQRMEKTLSAELVKVKKTKDDLERRRARTMEDIDKVSKDLKKMETRMRSRSNEHELLGKLPKEMWALVGERVDPNSLFAFAMTCRFFRDLQKTRKEGLKTDMRIPRLVKDGPGYFEKGFPKWFDEERKSSARRPYDTDSIQLAAFCNDQSSLSRFMGERKGGEEDLKFAIGGAALGGHLNLVKKLQAKGAVLQGEELLSAVTGGKTDVVRYIKSQDTVTLKRKNEEKLCSAAALMNHKECLQELRKRKRGGSSGIGRCRWNASSCSAAARGGHLDLLKWMRSQKPPCPWDKWTCAAAAKGGHLEVLKWARSQDPPCPWDEFACEGAAKSGNLELIKWLRGQDPPCPWDEASAEWAAFGGHIEVLKWLRAQDPPCPWDEQTAAAAASGGQLSILKFLLQEGLPLHEGSAHEASASGHLETLKWLRAQHCPWDPVSCYIAAEQNGFHDISSFISSTDPEAASEAEDELMNDLGPFPMGSFTIPLGTVRL